MLIKFIAVVAVLFAAGVATSFAEYKFQYSLYLTVAGVIGKVKAAVAKLRKL